MLRNGVLAVVPPTTAEGDRNRLWDSMRPGASLADLLPIATHNFGTGVGAMPPFALLSLGTDLHVMLRGPFLLTVESEEQQVVGGERITTWMESFVDGAGAGPFRLDFGALPVAVAPGAGTSGGSRTGAPGAAGEAEGLLGGYMLETGMVLASSLHRDALPAFAGPLPAAVSAAVAEPSRVASVGNARGARQDDPADEPGGPDRTIAEDDSATINPLLYPGDSDGDAGDEPVTPTSGQPEGTLPVHVPAVTPATAVPVPSPSPSPQVPAAPRALIDSIPWLRSAAPPRTIGSGDGEETVHRSPTGTADSVSHAAADRTAGSTADHDGDTVMRSSLAAPAAVTTSSPAVPTAGTDTATTAAPQREDADTVIRPRVATASSAPATPRASSAPATPRVPPGPATGPLIVARMCLSGHANAPTRSGCSECSSALKDETEQVRRPSLGQVRVSTGEVIELERSLIIGRQPSVSRVAGREMPRLVQVRSNAGDISRSHVEVRLDGWHVLLCDLRATNGTVLIRGGQPPRRLGEGESAFLFDGDIAQLGEDLSLRFEGLP